MGDSWQSWEENFVPHHDSIGGAKDGGEQCFYDVDEVYNKLS